MVDAGFAGAGGGDAAENAVLWFAGDDNGGSFMRGWGHPASWMAPAERPDERLECPTSGMGCAKNPRCRARAATRPASRPSNSFLLGRTRWMPGPRKGP